MPVEYAIPLAILLVFMNGFFVAAEFALVKIRPTRIEELAAGGSRAAKMTRVAVHKLDAYLSATQLGITLASIGLGWVGEPAFAVLLTPFFQSMNISDRAAHGISFAIAYFFVTLLHVVIGELMPKSWAIQRSDRVALAVSYPLHVFYVIFLPLIQFLNGIANALLRLFGIRPASEHEMAHSHEELNMIVAASGQSGVLRASEVDLMRHVFRFGDRVAVDVMTPRVDMVVLRASTPVQEALDVALDNPFSRYPVVGEDSDDILGMVHVKDLVRLQNAGHEGLADAIREVLFVPENKMLESLLQDFQQTRTHMAIVRDEYGGTEGLVTLEDVVEQIVGSIADESDIDVPGIQPLEDGWIVLGKIRIDELNEALGTNFASEAYESIGGYVSGLLGKAPVQGDKAHDGEWEFEVVESEKQRIRTLKLTRRKEERDGQEG